MSGEEDVPPANGADGADAYPGDKDNNSETLSPEEPVVVEAEGEGEAEPEPEQPQPTPAPVETPSTSNNALIMQIKILQEYAKDIKRTMNSVATATGVHHEYVRRAVSNLVTAVVEHNGDIETLQEIYSEGNYALRAKEIYKLLILVDSLVNKNQSPEDSNNSGL
jgi:hypothetical protein